MWKDFKDYLVKQNVIALALAVVIGVALNDVVQGIVKDLIMPFVTAITPSTSTWETLTTPGPIPLKLGHLASVALNFVIIAFVVWRISKLVTPPPAPPGRSCPFCKLSVDSAATRCPHCTSQLA